MISEEQLRALLEEIKRRIKSVENNQPLYRALDAAVPIVMDGRVVVVGLDAQHAFDLSTFNSGDNAPVIRKVLSAVANKPLELLVIEGTTLEDYDQHQQREAAAEEARRKVVESAEVQNLTGMPAEALPESDEVADDDRFDPSSETSSTRLLLMLNRHLHVRYRATRNRTSPTVRARFMLDALAELELTVARVYELEDSEVMRERQIARAIDRLADLVNIDGMVVALEFERHRGNRN